MAIKKKVNLNVGAAAGSTYKNPIGALKGAQSPERPKKAPSIGGRTAGTLTPASSSGRVGITDPGLEGMSGGGPAEPSKPKTPVSPKANTPRVIEPKAGTPAKDTTPVGAGLNTNSPKKAAAVAKPKTPVRRRRRTSATKTGMKFKDNYNPGKVKGNEWYNS